MVKGVTSGDEILPRISFSPTGRWAGKVAVDLCSGLGGFSIAARWMGMKVAAAADIWKHAATTHSQNFPGTTFVHGDILHDSTMAKLESAADAVGGCDIMLAGPPCQGFSQIQNGRHNAADPRNEVIKAMPSAVARLQPKAFAIENVAALLTHGGGGLAASILKRLANPKPGLHYRLEACAYDAAAFGVPQQRRRAFIIGILEGEGELHPPSMPDLTQFLSTRRRRTRLHPDIYLERILADHDDDRLVGVWQALSDLPALPQGAQECPRPYRTRPVSRYQKRMRQDRAMVSSTGTPSMSSLTAERLRVIPPGGCVTDLPDYLTEGLGRKFYSAYRRLHPELPATTLSTKIDCAYHPTALRALNVREYARLQSIPDSYTFPVAARNAYAMIGNAVPPLMAARVLEASITL